MTERPDAPVVEVEHRPAVVRVKISGTMDERFGRDAFVSLKGRTETIVVDLDAVNRITSFGVREWMTALRDLTTENYFFTKCRPAVFAQFNSVNGFGGRGRVATFYCPYVCPECETAFDVLVDLRTQRDVVVSRVAPPAKCPNCGADAEFDDIESSYFARVAAEQLPTISPAVAAAIDGVAAPAEPLRIDKTVDGELTVLWLAGGLEKGARLKRHVDGLEGTVLVVLGDLKTSSQKADKAAEQLRPLLDAPDAVVFLARVPLPIARALADSGTGRAQVASVVTTAPCSACSYPAEIDVSALAGGTTSSYACPRCKSVAGVVVTMSEADAAVVAKLAIQPVPEGAARYLDPDTRTHEPGGGSSPPKLAPLALESGARIGKYEVVRRLGMGGMAEVLLGRQTGVEGFEKKVVIKRILPHLAVQPQFVQMFVSEARVAARLLHPNVVQIYDLVREGEDYYSIMEYVRGADLNVLLKMATRLDVQVPVELCCRIVADTCAALEAAHSYTDDDGTKKPILHRDVSPHNVLVSTDGQVKLTDFGVAKAADSLHQSATGSLKGKVIYMAPEHILGKPNDHRIDIFAAGLVLYTSLTQQHPFFRGSELQSLTAVLEAPIPRVDALRSDVPKELADIVSRAIERDPERRYPTSLAMQEDLERFLSSYGKPASAAHLATWVRAFLERAKALEAMPDDVLVTPSRSQANLDAPTTLTTPLTPSHAPIEARRIAMAAGAETPFDDGGPDLPFDVDD
jgi:eukaryotic-like serine/threonine-protein kinase